MGDAVKRDAGIVQTSADGSVAVRTFRSVVESLRISAAAKRELIALHQRELDAERAAAEARCVAPGLVDELRTFTRGAAEIGYAEALHDVASELQRYGTDAERAAKAVAREARVHLTMATSRVPALLVDAAQDGVFGRIEEMRERDRLPRGSSDRIGPSEFGPAPLAAAIVRQREAGITVTRVSDDADEVKP